LNIAKWLYEICPTINISVSSNYPFRYACGNGDIDMAIWLCQLNPLYYIEIKDDDIVCWHIKKPIIINQTKNIILAESMKCSICIDKDVNIQTNCEHSYCLDCITEWHNKSDCCPYCRQQLTDFYQIVQKIE
jgi:hypothetical protein